LTEAYDQGARSVKMMVGTVMTPEERRQEITRLAQAEGRVLVEELVGRLKASRETIRRDLTVLADRGILLKYHGGARTPRPDVEGPFQARMAANMPAKRAIAAAAARLFEPGDTLFVDTGTTTLCLAEALGRLSGLTVVTNAPRLAAAIAGSGGANQVFLIGGAFKTDAAETVGPLAIEQIRRFRPRHAVLTIGALDVEGGVMDYDIDEAEVAAAMIAQAEVLTVVADASKLGRRALFPVCPLATLDRLVTDTPPPPALAAALAEAGVTVILAEGAV
jgi:DeoR family glycerol-3-phosphate regulon repressor